MSQKITALVVDDEEFARENLRMFIEEYCPEIELIGAAKSAAEARQLILEQNPSIVFLDIMMPGEDGFTFLKSVEDRTFHVIFTTAFREHALRAIKEAALDYLEKPIDIDELKKAVARAVKQVELEKPTAVSNDRMSRVLQEIVLTNNVEKTVVPTRDGIAIIKNVDIIHLEASENYTTLYVLGGKKYVSSKSIKAFEDKLDPNMFFRVHKSHIINMAHHLRELKRSEGNIAVLTDGTEIPVSRRKLQEFLDKISHL